MGCIYKATNKVNGKAYIGQTNFTLDKRRREHERAAKRRPNTYFLKALNKYGFNSFEWEILEAGIDDHDRLNEAEKKNIAIHKTVKPGGYNLTYGGEGGVPCQGTIEKMRKIAKANHGDLFYKARMDEGQRRAMARPEYKAKMQAKSERQKMPVLCIESGKYYESRVVAERGEHASVGIINNGEIKKVGDRHWYRPREQDESIDIEQLRRHVAIGDILNHARKHKGKALDARNRRCLAAGCIRTPRDAIITPKRVANIRRAHKQLLRDEREMERQRRRATCNNTARSIICVESGEIFNSTKEAGRKLGLDHRRVRLVCQGKAKTLYGKHYQYTECPRG